MSSRWACCERQWLLASAWAGMDSSKWSASLFGAMCFEASTGFGRSTVKMIRSFIAIAGICSMVGCSSQAPTVPNPFNTADRVPPPMMRNAAGTQPYYSGAPTAAAPAFGSLPVGPTPIGQAPVGPGSPAPGTATPFYGASVNRAGATPGDAIAVPSDSSSLRFAAPDAAAFARRSTVPVQRSENNLIASNNASSPRVATANGWIAGSAPVRGAEPVASPRVRLPGAGEYREPVSIAAIDGGVRTAPLEPIPTDRPAGEPAPLRIATPSSATGWR